VRTTILSENLIPGFARAIGGDGLEERIARIQERFRDSKRDGRNVRLLVDGDDVAAAVSIRRLSENSWQMHGPLLVPGRAPGDAAPLVAEAMLRLGELEALKVSHRPFIERCDDGWREALRAAGWHLAGERVEYDAPIDSLPDDEGTPLDWREYAAVGHEFAAGMLERCAAGDPHGLQKRDVPSEVIHGYLRELKLTNGPECIEIGYLDGEPVAFLCAQVALSDGWSRVTYMGLVESARGRGLGKWVHRRGFGSMRRQGGKTYHGGTAVENRRMVALFESHGCRERWRMEDWTWAATQSTR